MAKTGLSDKIIFYVTSISEGRKDLLVKGREAIGRKTFNKGISGALKTLQEAAKTKDVATLANAELIFAYQEYMLRDKGNKQATGSLAHGVQDMLDVVKVLALSDNELKVSDKIISSKDIDRVDGSPKDAFHKCCSSQITRLNNSLKSNMASPAERELIHQRIENLKHAKDLHLEKQSSIMPKRSRGKEIAE